MEIFRFPIARITLFFVVGIVVAKYYAIQLQDLLLFSSGTLLVFISAYLAAKKQFQQRLYFGLSVIILSFTIGVITHRLHSDVDNSAHYLQKISNLEQPQKLELILREKMKSKMPNLRFIADVNHINENQCNGKILLNIKCDSAYNIFTIGTRVRANTIIIKNSKTLNPNQFDYGKYLTNKSIYAQVYVRATDLEIATLKHKNLWYYSDLVRSKILKNLRKSNFNERELTVLSALILGQQQEISPDILRDYQYAGAIHILSFSGLHVGFILLFINFALRHLPVSKISIVSRILIIIIALWSFAIIAGMSASVVRAVTMFSFVAIGMHLKRDTNIYHTLLVSIFLILLCRPSFLFDVGFQLSYCALFFIIWLQPLFASIWKPKIKIIKYFWDILTVSFAAQIGTLPLSIFYFHQFPGLFFITNLVILPFLSVIMGIGLITTIIASFGRVPDFLVALLENMIASLNIIIAKIASWEDFVIVGIPLNGYLMCVLYLTIITTILYFKKPMFIRLSFALVSILILQISFSLIHFENFEKSELIVFDARRNTIISEYKNAQIELFSNDTSATKIVEPYRLANFATITKLNPIQNVLYFNRRKILIIDSCGIIPNVSPNIIVLRGSPKINLDRYLHQVNPDVIIADRSNYRSYVQIWSETCKKQKIPFHYIGEKGFYKQ